MTTVAVLGAGRMGGAMVGRLRRSGFDVVAWNRDRAKADEVARTTGAGIAESPSEAAAASDVAITSLADDAAVETVYAMTVHKAQGSQFGTAAVLLPAASSQVLTRELLYTAVTRAQSKLILAATEATIRAAVARPVARASGLAARLR